MFITKNEIDYQQLLESRRHNVATEAQASEELAERRRSNQASESLTASRDSATAAHYLRSDTLGSNQLAEAIRHNYAVETETQRHNVRTEDDAIAMHQDKMNNNLEVAIVKSNNPIGQVVGEGYLVSNSLNGFNTRDTTPKVSSSNVSTVDAISSAQGSGAKRNAGAKSNAVISSSPVSDKVKYVVSKVASNVGNVIGKVTSVLSGKR